MPLPEHAAQPVAAPLRLLSINPNGLRDAAKRRQLLGAFIDGPWHILCVQEAHAVSAAEVECWARDGAGLGMPLHGVVFANPLSNLSAGVALLAKDGAPASGLRLAAAPGGGRLLDVELSFAGLELSVVTCYAPHVGQARPAFFEGPLAALLRPGRPVLACGDWNCVLDDDDVSGGEAGGRAQGAAQLEALLVQRGLVDAWRHLHPAGRGVTHVGTAGGTSARLDRWYVSEALLPWVRSCEHVMGLPGDHLGVALELAPPGVVPCGPGRWRLPLSLLLQQEYSDGLRAEAAAFLAANPAQPGTARQRWDDLKAHLAQYSRGFTLRSRRAASAERRQLLGSAQHAQRRYSANPAVPGNLQAFRQAQQALQEHDAAAAAQRAEAAQVLWHCYGERPTKWFHQLGRRVLPHQPIPAVLDPADPGAPPADLATRAGLQLGKQRAAAFFSGDSPCGLFRPAPTDPDAQAQLLDALDTCLSEGAAQATLGPDEHDPGRITGEEVVGLLPKLPRGVSPGLDGLPYEFYVHFWEVLEGAFLAMAAEALSAGGGGAVEGAPGTGVLPPSMLVGLVVLLHKGGGKDARDFSSYRPITLLNCDYRLLARVLCARFAGPLCSVIDPTQTAFLPGRWIGDNVLYHLEEVQYLQEAEGVPGCIVFLDFEKAYDRCSREWLYQVMGRLGFPEPSVRWVRIMLAGTVARVSLNGHYTDLFSVRSSVQQGSPLSVLLYNITVQPMAAHLRRQQAAGALAPIPLPGGAPAPPCHQHADDTTLHVATPADAAAALAPTGSVGLHCRASGSRLQPTKCKGLCFGPHPQRDATTGVCALSGVTFPPPQDPIRHLGIFLGTDPVAANARTYARLLHSVREDALLWRAHRLSWLGRAYIAKQVLAAKVTYHTTFVPAPRASRLLGRIAGIISAFVAGGSLAEEAPPGGAGLSFPALRRAALPWQEGGVGLADPIAQADCLRAKVAARLVQPGQHPWKLLMQARWECLLPALGPAVLVSSLQADGRLAAFKLLGERHTAYIHGFQRTMPHRLQPAADLTPRQVGVERLFHNRQVKWRGEPLDSRKHAGAVAAGVTTVGRLAALVLAAQAPGAAALCPALQRVWDCVPAAWQQAALQPLGPEWECAPAAGLVRSAAGVLHRAASNNGALTQLAGTAVLPPGLDWEPCCVLSVPLDKAHPEAGSASYLLGPWSDVQVDPSVWGHGEASLLDFTVKAAAVRRAQLRAAAEGKGWYLPGGGWCPSLWDRPPGAAPSSSTISGLAALEQHWCAEHAAQLHGQRPRAADFVPPPPAWMRSPAAGKRPREGVFERVAKRRAAAAAVVVEGPAPGAAAADSDEMDVAAPDPDAPAAVVALRAEVRGAWEYLRKADLPREQYSTAYRIMHGALHVGAKLCAMHVLPPGEAYCTHPGCQEQLETLSHAFLTCPAVAPAAAWVRAFFAAAAGGPPPPEQATALLAFAHCAAWGPDEGGGHLWWALRASFLHAVWTQRCARSLTGTPLTPASVCGMIVASLRASIRRDWARVTSSFVALSGAPPEWFLGPDPRLSCAAFEERWACGGVLCSVEQPASEGAQPRMHLHLSTTHPLPLPGPPPPPSPPLDPAAAAPP